MFEGAEWSNFDFSLSDYEFPGKSERLRAVELEFGSGFEFGLQLFCDETILRYRVTISDFASAISILAPEFGTHEEHVQTRGTRIMIRSSYSSLPVCSVLRLSGTFQANAVQCNASHVILGDRADILV